MKTIYRVLIAGAVFAWIFGIAPVIVYLRDWQPFGLERKSVVAFYCLLPLELFIAAAGAAIIIVPLACLVEWAINGPAEAEYKKHKRPVPKTPQDLYVEGKIDIQELERRIK